MTLQVALRQEASGLRVTVDGAIVVDGAGPFERVMGPLLIGEEDAAPVLAAFWKKDLKEAAAAFEFAFARSYGVARVEIVEVLRLHIEPDRPRPTVG